MENESFCEGRDAIGLGTVRAIPRPAVHPARQTGLQRNKGAQPRRQMGMKFLDATAGSTAATDTAGR